MLLLNGTLTESPGLVHGKMGIAVFFFHYAKYSGNMLFADYAIDLIGEIQNQIHINSPADYENGIAGIGVGIDYLIRNHFLLVEEDICEDFDARMIRAVLSDPFLGFSLYDGLVGYGRYWISRLNCVASVNRAKEYLLYIIEYIKEKWAMIPPEEQTDVYTFLFDVQKIVGYEQCKDLLKKCESWAERKTFSRLGNTTIGCKVREIQRYRYFNEINSQSSERLNRFPNLNMEASPIDRGILGGYAGEGFLRLETLQKTDYLWAFLL